jgi:hypothetical protein
MAGHRAREDVEILVSGVASLGEGVVEVVVMVTDVVVVWCSR